MEELRLVLAGAAPGNGNRGVEALARSVMDSVDREGGHSVISVLDDGWGVRDASQLGYQHARVEYVGVRRSRRWHRPESWAQIRLAQRFGVTRNAAAERFAHADAILDLSGGDSFTDLYGPARLALVSAPKYAATRAGKPLVLLPQTYGPFETASGRRAAERIVRSATLAYARDSWSYRQLLELAGPDAERSRLRRGVDVAFALEARRPYSGLANQVERWRQGLTVGVNVSGLLRDASSHTRFGLAGDYVVTMTELVRELLSAGAHVVFVPHVHTPDGSDESDVVAIGMVRELLGAPARAKTSVLPPHLAAAELKWCISQFDWFVGSRVHATIAALSTTTPVAAYAYSDKTQGVFDTCGMGRHVIDAREAGGSEAVRAILTSFEGRTQARAELMAHAPVIVAESRLQLRSIFEAVRQWRDGAGPVETIA